MLPKLSSNLTFARTARCSNCPNHVFRPSVVSVAASFTAGTCTHWMYLAIMPFPPIP